MARAKKLPAFRVHYLLCLAGLFLAINIVLRLALKLAFPEALPMAAQSFPSLLKGTLNDLATLPYILIIPATLILLPTRKFLNRPMGRFFCIFILFVYSTVFIFTAFSEYFFWDEFGSRFNFIAVDYLIYTTELMQNMVESYPLVPLLTAVFLLAVAATALLWRRLKKNPEPLLPASVPTFWKLRLASLGGIYALAGLLFLAFTPFSVENDRPWNEYAKNGTYEIFSAYLHNELDYRAFYPTMGTKEAFAKMRGELNMGDSYGLEVRPAGLSIKYNAGNVLPDSGLARYVEAARQEQRPNVILVLMESMGQSRLGENTPSLTALAAEGLSFSRMMSTGTRTVRGIEAVMLSVPPTPGNSIVRRPDNHALFTLGSLFRQRGYDMDFIYGGLGYFDNMNAFFDGNGYHAVDKFNFNPQSKTFSNAWGQCDADLYTESLLRADLSHKSGKLFHQVLLTTSNHRPFTFPEGKIDRQQGSRSSAINYADYAIGQFMQEARTKPWFENTIFVFIGDHPSSIAGKTEVPADAYGVVCVLYGPKFFQPEQVDTLCSQIDLAPTLLSSLNWNYPSQFFGTDARNQARENGRAWISTYQLLGFRTNDALVVLRPDGTAETTSLSKSSPVERESDIVERAVASYQCAYDLFNNKKMKEQAVMLAKPHNAPASAHGS